VIVMLGVTVAAQAPLEFDVASIKRSASSDPRDLVKFGRPPDPATGEIRLMQIPAQTLILQAYPLQTFPIQVLNLPAWAEFSGERYDVIAKGKPGAAAEDRQQMFRALLADRMKLAAHYETREQEGYDLVFARADKRLGDAIKPTSLDCSSGPATGLPAAATSPTDARAAALQRCGTFWLENDTLMSGGNTIANLAPMIARAAGRPVVDKTGIDGYFAITFRFQRMPARAGADPDPAAAPSVFTAVQEQLGLKLESAKTQAQVLVVDHIERPTEN